MDKIYDVAIIGAGPAGLSASIYARRKNLSVIIISNEIGGEVAESGDIENYLGFKSIKGEELVRKFEEHARKFSPDITFDYIKEIKKDNENFKIVGEKEYIAKTVIVATGRIHRRLEIPGEKEFVGHGVSYCVTCDAPFFQDKIVAVVGGGNTAVTSAILLSAIAKKVYIIHRRDKFRADEIEVDRMKKIENIELIMNSNVVEIKGDKVVKSIMIKNVKTNEIKELPIEGIFINIGEIANSTFLDKMVKINDRGEIIVDEICRTNNPGIFAAGDVTNIRDKQIITSAAQGAIAALSAYEYLYKNKRI